MSAPRLGLMGGTFDPIHHGHLLIAEMARVELRLDRVMWIPAGDPPHKQGEPISPQEHRYAMTLLATADNPYFTVSRLELERQGPSYTLYTLRDCRRLYPEADLFFITGADSILEIMTWHKPHEVIRAARFAALTRPGYDLAAMQQALPPDFLPQIDAISGPGMDISSTVVRARVRNGLPIRYLVPPSVAGYIEKYGLYRSEAPEQVSTLRAS